MKIEATPDGKITYSYTHNGVKVTLVSPARGKTYLTTEKVKDSSTSAKEVEKLWKSFK